jgi:hypothetical protein
MNHKYRGVVTAVLLVTGFGGMVVALAQLIVGCVYFDQCPANPIMSIFNVVSGVVGIIAALLLIVGAYLIWKDKDDKVYTRVILIIAGVIHIFFFAWYMYGGTLSSVGNSASLRQSTNATNTSTYCAYFVQRMIDAVLLMYWITIIIIVSIPILIVMEKTGTSFDFC